MASSRPPVVAHPLCERISIASSTNPLSRDESNQSSESASASWTEGSGPNGLAENPNSPAASTAVGTLYHRQLPLSNSGAGLISRVSTLRMMPKFRQWRSLLAKRASQTIICDIDLLTAASSAPCLPRKRQHRSYVEFPRWLPSAPLTETAGTYSSRPSRKSSHRHTGPSNIRSTV